MHPTQEKIPSSKNLSYSPVPGFLKYCDKKNANLKNIEMVNVLFNSNKLPILFIYIGYKEKQIPKKKKNIMGDQIKKQFLRCPIPLICSIYISNNLSTVACCLINILNLLTSQHRFKAKPRRHSWVVKRLNQIYYSHNFFIIHHYQVISKEVTCHNFRDHIYDANYETQKQPIIS